MVNDEAKEGDSESEEEEEKEQEKEEERKVATRQEAVDGLAAIRSYVTGHETSEEHTIFDTLEKLDAYLRDRALAERKQKNITDFF